MATTYKALALFLSYPTNDLRAAGCEAMAAIEREALVPARIIRALKRLAERLAGADLYALQEEYVWLFDRTRSLSLNLYEHVHGESRERGQAMVALSELYRANGLELASGELPDHLPVFLEFLSTLPEADAASLLGEAAHVIAAIGERLHTRGSLYRAVFGALAALSAAPADRAALAALMAEPDDDPGDLAALDKLWAETPVTFGPEASREPSPARGGWRSEAEPGGRLSPPAGRVPTSNPSPRGGGAQGRTVLKRRGAA